MFSVSFAWMAQKALTTRSLSRSCTQINTHSLSLCCALTLLACFHSLSLWLSGTGDAGGISLIILLMTQRRTLTHTHTHTLNELHSTQMWMNVAGSSGSNNNNKQAGGQAGKPAYAAIWKPPAATLTLFHPHPNQILFLLEMQRKQMNK